MMVQFILMLVSTMLTIVVAIYIMVCFISAVESTINALKDVSDNDTNIQKKDILDIVNFLKVFLVFLSGTIVGVGYSYL